jgi:hypothetical protein
MRHGDIVSHFAEKSRDQIPPERGHHPYHVVMSCIRFNTTAQRAQMGTQSHLTSGDPVAAFLSPEITSSKIERVRLLSQDPNPKIRESAALSYHAPLEVYEKLSRDPDEGVRACLARNHATPCDVLRVLASDSSETVRAFVAVNYSVPADAMDKLARDDSPTVQKLVAWKASLRDEAELSLV